MVALAVAITACTAPVPEGYFFPTHSMIGEGPSGAGEGRLELMHGCFYVADFLLVWPRGYSMIETDEGIAVSGDGIVATEGDTIVFGGGAYEQFGTLPDVAASALEVPCPGPPYFLVTRLTDVSG